MKLETAPELDLIEAVFLESIPYSFKRNPNESKQNTKENKNTKSTLLEICETFSEKSEVKFDVKYPPEK